MLWNLLRFEWNAHNVFWMYLFSSDVVLFFVYLINTLEFMKSKFITLLMELISLYWTLACTQRNYNNTDLISWEAINCVFYWNHIIVLHFIVHRFIDSSMRWKAHCHIQWFAKMIILHTPHSFEEKKPQSFIFRLKSEPDKSDWKNRLFLIWSV